MEARKLHFDVKTFLGTVDLGRSVLTYRTDQTVFSGGDLADAVFYIQEGKIKVTVHSEQGKEAIVAMHSKD